MDSVEVLGIGKLLRTERPGLLYFQPQGSIGNDLYKVPGNFATHFDSESLRRALRQCQGMAELLKKGRELLHDNSSD